MYIIKIIATIHKREEDNLRDSIEFCSGGEFYSFGEGCPERVTAESLLQ